MTVESTPETAPETPSPVCPCCGKLVPPDKLAVFQANLARFTADNPDAQDLLDAMRGV